MGGTTLCRCGERYLTPGRYPWNRRGRDDKIRTCDSLTVLTWTNADRAHDELRFVAGKTGRRMILPLAVPLRRHVETLAAGDDPKQALHPRAFKSIARQGGRVASLSGQFYDLMAEAGLVPAKTHARNKAKANADGGKGRAGRRRA